MINKKLSKLDAEKKIQDFFKNLNNQTTKEMKKIKTLAMHHHISLNKYKRLFCKKCLSPYKSPIIRIKKGIKSLTCKECGYVNRYKMKI